ncbi:sirohydrochlorin chelatase [Actinocorallia herbida]|nr:CbiX/SirB N-terminal domain-containing protein [Actinocorallia herbida]
MSELADLIEAAHPGIPVHAGADETLGELVGDPAAVVVPLLLGPDRSFETALRQGLSALPVLVSESLGPHPLLAEALHLRLAEAGLARADRIRMMSMVTAADGVVLGCRAADESAEITSVLLASRLAVPVVAAPIEDPAALAAAAGALRANGAQRIAFSPFVFEAAADELAKAAEAAAAEPAAPLGGHSSVAQLAVLRYVEALEAIYTGE